MKKLQQTSWRATLALASALLLLAGTQAHPRGSAAGIQDQRRALVHEGIERSYIVHLPPGFDRTEAHPLIFNIHGGGGRAEKVNAGTLGTFNREADRQGFVVVYPQGVGNRWSDGRTEMLPGGGARDDVGFFDAMIAALKKDYGIDAGRIFAAGQSNGGFMSLRLALDRTSQFAAVAPVNAQMPKALAGRRPQGQISLMLIQGTADPLVPYDGGHVRLFKSGRSRGEILSTAKTIEIFRDHDGCRKQPVQTDIPDLDQRDGCRGAIFTYGGCAGGTEVVLVKMIGGGHTWPGGLQYLPKSLVGPVCRDLDASRLIVDFFARHRR